MARMPRRGDRVRVVVEGVVFSIMEDGERSHATVEYIDVDGDTQRAAYLPLSELEVLPEPLKVGDMVGGSDLFALPPGAVVKAISDFDSDDEVVFVRTPRGFVNAAGVHFTDGSLSEPRELVYLPKVTT